MYIFKNAFPVFVELNEMPSIQLNIAGIKLCLCGLHLEQHINHRGAVLYSNTLLGKNAS